MKSFQFALLFALTVVTPRLALADDAPAPAPAPVPAPVPVPVLPVIDSSSHRKC